MGQVAASRVLSILENAANVNLVIRYFKWNLIADDPDDNKFVDCAIASNARFIVSEDRHFQVLKQIPFPQVTVLDIAEFRAELFQKPG
jgi:predicted nucleic acid-binding protein